MDFRSSCNRDSVPVVFDICSNDYWNQPGIPVEHMLYASVHGSKPAVIDSDAYYVVDDDSFEDNVPQYVSNSVLHMAEAYNSDERFAVKSVFKSSLDEKSTLVTAASLVVHAQMNHPNIVRMIGASEDFISVDVYMEPVKGSGVGDWLVESHFATTEDNVRQLALGVLSGLKHMHESDFIHRDISSTTVSVELSDGGKVDTAKISDLSAAAPCNVKLPFAGSTVWSAPEVRLDGAQHSKASDVWAAGLLLFYAFYGYNPVDIDPRARDIAIAPARNVSPLAANLLKRLLSSNPADRPTAVEALDHEWFHQPSLSSCTI